MEGLAVWETMIAGNLKYVTKLPAAALTLVIAYVLLWGLRRVIVSGTSLAKIDPTVQSMILSAVSFAGWVLALAAALSVMELHQLSLALGGSIALVAMALATGLNSVAQDLMAGIFLISDDDFTVGRRVKAAGVEGVIEALSIRKTKIRDAQGQIHTVPNRSIDQGTYVILEKEDQTDDVQRGKAG